MSHQSRLPLQPSFSEGRWLQIRWKRREKRRSVSVAPPFLFFRFSSASFSRFRFTVRFFSASYRFAPVLYCFRFGVLSFRARTIVLLQSNCTTVNVRGLFEMFLLVFCLSKYFSPLKKRTKRFLKNSKTFRKSSEKLSPIMYGL